MFKGLGFGTSGGLRWQLTDCLLGTLVLGVARCFCDGFEDFRAPGLLGPCSVFVRIGLEVRVLGFQEPGTVSPELRTSGKLRAS